MVTGCFVMVTGYVVTVTGCVVMVQVCEPRHWGLRDLEHWTELVII